MFLTLTPVGGTPSCCLKAFGFCLAEDAAEVLAPNLPLLQGRVVARGRGWCPPLWPPLSSPPPERRKAG